MNSKEAELVSKKFVKENTNYNLCSGGKGGWGYVNNEILDKKKRKEISKIGGQTGKGFHNKKHSEETKMKISIKMRGNKFFTGRKHSEETKIKMKGPRQQSSGSRNSQYGTMWITDGQVSKKIKKDELIPEGWKRGRTSVKETQNKGR